MVTIPFIDFAAFDEEVILDGVPYKLTFDYNERGEYWSMSIATRDLVPIVNGIKLVLGYQLFDQYQGRDLPPGELYVVDTTDDISKIDRENIVDTLSLVYIEEDEVDAI